MDDDARELRKALLFNGSSIAVSLGLGGVAFPSALSFFGLLPSALGMLGLYHYARARAAADGATTAHHANLSTHFGLLAVSIAGGLLTIVLMGILFVLKD